MQKDINKKQSPIFKLENHICKTAGTQWLTIFPLFQNMSKLEAKEIIIKNCDVTIVEINVNNRHSHKHKYVVSALKSKKYLIRKLKSIGNIKRFHIKFKDHHDKAKVINTLLNINLAKKDKINNQNSQQ